MIHWLVDSNPAGVGLGAFLPTLVPRPFGLIEALLRMIALQVSGASVLTLWAAWQLRRPRGRLTTGIGRLWQRWIWRATRRPGRGGDLRRRSGALERDPLPARGSLAGRLVAGLMSLVGIAVLALGTSWFALPAFSELAERGYGAAREGFTMPDVNPLARVLIGKLLFPAGAAAPGQARLEFNIALRQFSALLAMLYVAMVCGTAAMSMIHRTRTRHLAELDRDVSDRLGDPSGQDARSALESPQGRPDADRALGGRDSPRAPCTRWVS